ncbi:hypothetical protein [Leptolyngbya sp. KIOST-1]|uniref:hypothetical protein n=1 Tax=Leptolyngbya sp. KIOST-1 TaxID=1229172 RepID=UPI0005648A47|nr:hypothetical protein [Leptolyngbya sp. KIOST-1]
MRLSPATTYYIRNLLTSSVKTQESAGNQSFYRRALLNLETALKEQPFLDHGSELIQRLEDLVLLHKTLNAQAILYASYSQELSMLEQEMFKLLEAWETVC